MFNLALFLLSFCTGLTVSLWIRGQFRDSFVSKKEYHLHMATVFSTFALAFSTIIHYKQYLFL